MICAPNTFQAAWQISWYWLGPLAPVEWHRQPVLGALLGCSLGVQGQASRVHPPQPSPGGRRGVVVGAEVRERDDVVAALVRFEFGGEGAADLDEVGVGQGGRVDGGAAG